MSGNRKIDLLAEGIQETSLRGIPPAIAGKIAKARAQAAIRRGDELTIVTVGTLNPTRDGVGAQVQRVVRRKTQCD